VPSPAKLVTVTVLGGAAVAAAGAAIVLALDTQSKHNQYAAQSCATLPSQPPSTPCGQLAQSGQSEGTLANALYVGGGALAGAALATMFLWPNAPAASSWVVQPRIDPRSAAAVLVGAF
jgi:hypothetical protein